MVVLLLLAGCGSTGVKSCDAAVDLGEGSVAALVDGEAWTASGGTWRWAGESLQVNTVGAGSWWLSLVAQTTPDGASVRAAVDAGELPVTVTLRAGADGGWATFYPDQGASYTTENADGGELEVVSVEGDSLRACFSFQAGSEEGGTVAVENGTMNVLFTE